MTRNFLFVILFTLLCCGDSVFSQEWEFFMDSYIESPYTRNFTDAIELSDGSIVINSPFKLPIEGHATV
ncbi:MAG: hypothetical protein IJE47_06090, partial [Bacteroidales bacterium]|nr:hypothetical protein [Bacteroidales bacterium]